MRFVVECGGDVDTIGAMAGALWGIANGAERLPLVNLEARDDLVDIASRMFRRYASLATVEQGAARRW
jgi:poly(ADP-ribose) glycohydrolase ARH3